jgi:cell division protease FtsH
MQLGATMQLPERDRLHLSRRILLTHLKVLYAGRIAEEIFCHDITAGSANDFERATELARHMVCEWGMSEAVGPINYAQGEETLFLGREITRTQTHSEALSVRIDEEVKKIVEECYAAARVLLEEHMDAVGRVAEALLVKETLSGAEVGDLMGGKGRPEDPR